MKRIVLIVLALVATYASAQPTQVFIPGKTWVLTFDIGLVTHYQARSSSQQFQYQAGASSVFGAPAIMLSFFLEPEASESNQACHKTFWGRASSNPLVDADTVKHQSLGRYEQVLYRLKNGQQHGNFYFVKDGACADVHISVSKVMPLSEELVSGFARTLKW